MSALTGRPPGHLAGALLELRDPPPTWEGFRHTPQIGGLRCDARHPGGPVFRVLQHPRYVCTRHRYWIGPPEINDRGPIWRLLLRPWPPNGGISVWSVVTAGHAGMCARATR